MPIEQILVNLYPAAKREYIRALTSPEGVELLQTKGILDAPARLCHFIAQCAHETGGHWQAGHNDACDGSVRQHMHQEAPDELIGCQRHGLVPAGSFDPSGLYQRR